jgi:hypothetical protein
MFQAGASMLTVEIASHAFRMMLLWNMLLPTKSHPCPGIVILSEYDQIPS